MISFIQNMAKITNQLPSLPTELQIIILKLSSASIKDSVVHQAFTHMFRIQRKNVKIWLNFLVVHHPDYQDIMVNQEHLTQLPEDETIMDELKTVMHDKKKGIENKSSSLTQVKKNTSMSEVNLLDMSY